VLDFQSAKFAYGLQNTGQKKLVPVEDARLEALDSSVFGRLKNGYTHLTGWLRKVT
jgi:hypothetical protein